MLGLRHLTSNLGLLALTAIRAVPAAQEGAVLCFDEVMTGFRIAKGCAQEYFGITPDVTTMGKVIGGGLPVGAYGGKKELMQMVAPAGPMYQVRGWARECAGANGILTLLPTHASSFFLACLCRRAP